MEKTASEKITVPPAKFIVGLKQRFIFQLSMLHILWIALSVYRNPFLAFRVLKKLMQKRQAVHGNLPIRKYVKSGKYLELAKALGAGFVQLLEPRKVGHFQGKDVELGEKHLEIMKHFYLKVNSDPAYREYPIVMYPGFHQRLLGCFGAGNRYLYVDSNGNLHACPFCQHKTGNALTDSISEAILKMQATGCHEFKTIARE